MESTRPHVGLDKILPIASVSLDGQLPTIVGGQAVNFWAELYLEKIPELLTPLRPFVSKDLDLYGDIEILHQLSRHYQVSANFAPPRLPVLGNIMVPQERSDPIKVELLHNVHGISRKDLEENYRFKLGDNTVQVLCPVTCLKAKLANAADLEQMNRQDVKHVKILIGCNREHLKELLKAAYPTKTMRNILSSCQRLYEVVNSENAKKVLQKWQVSVADAFPLQELGECAFPKIQNFVRFQIGKERGV